MRGRVPVGRDITHYNAFVPGAQFGTPRTYGVDLAVDF